MASGYIEARPFGRGEFRRFFVFGEPRFLFGRNLPQTLYTWSMSPIGLENSWGAGLFMGKGFEVRWTQHFLITRFGARDQYLGACRPGAQRPLGALQHDWGTEIFRNQALLKVCWHSEPRVLPPSKLPNELTGTEFPEEHSPALPGLGGSEIRHDPDSASDPPFRNPDAKANLARVLGGSRLG